MQTPQNSSKLLTYWWNKGDNFGDVMNRELLEVLTGYSIEWSDDKDVPVFSAAGSIIDTFHTKPGWTIWGAGVISKNAGIPQNLDIRAVRGPKTRNHLLNNGYENIPEIYGDPGLLLPICFPQNNAQAEYDIGIIPHYAFRLHPAIHLYKFQREFRRTFRIGGMNRVQFISPKLPVHLFLNKLTNCKAILANSLHGLIVAMAYGIPCVWIHFANDPFEGRVTSPFEGDTFKYLDFLQSVGSSCTNPVLIRNTSDWKTAIDKLKDYEPVQFDPKPLLDAFPYKTASWSSWVANWVWIPMPCWLASTTPQPRRRLPVWIRVVETSAFVCARPSRSMTR